MSSCNGNWPNRDAGASTCARLSPGRRARLSYYHPVGEDFALWCPEDVYIEEPTGLIQACLAACQRHGAMVAEKRAGRSG